MWKCAPWGGALGREGGAFDPSVILQTAVFNAISATVRNTLTTDGIIIIIVIISIYLFINLDAVHKVKSA